MNKQQRLLSLDIFRGITIAGMTLVNNPGSWETVYAPLRHADWHGVTPTDWVFPFFLFIVGVAIPLALGKRKEEGAALGAIQQKIGWRVLAIFGFGLLLAAYPHFGMTSHTGALAWIHYTLLALFLLSLFVREIYRRTASEEEAPHAAAKMLGYTALGAAAGMVVIGFFVYDLSALRIPGVLQRIALVYGACALIYLHTAPRTQVWIGVGLLLLYWGLMTLVPVPGGYPPNLEAETNLGAWLDRTLMGGHLWSQAKVWDPEGLLSTIPAISSGLAGVLTGEWLRSDRGHYEKISGILSMGAILLALSFVWDLSFPINKKIWTSSYVLYTSGVAMLMLGCIYWLVDCKGYRGWTKPFVVYGMNALFVYIATGLLVKLFASIKWMDAAGEETSSLAWLYQTLFVPAFASPYNASLAYGLFHVAFFLALAWVLYAKKIFIRV